MPTRLNALLSACCLAASSSNAAEPAAPDGWDVSSPPGQTREVGIDVRSGTWMSLDISPDGETIAFDLLGDIYLLPIEGGEARAIDSGLAWSMQPRFSPDGSEIAFVSDAGGSDNVWTMAADGSDVRQLTREEFRLLNNPWWSPDGQWIAARKHFTTTRSLGTGEIWLYHRDGGGGVPVIERPDEKHQKELGEPAFSPDGRYLYFSVDSTPGGTFQYAQDSNGQIYEIRRHDLQTGEIENFVTGAGGAVRPTPSPDGRYLAFVRRIRADSALFLKDLVNGRDYPIFSELDQDLQEVWGVHGLYPNMDWTPDSGHLVFWAGGGLTTEHYWYQKTDVWKHPILSRFVPPQILQPRSVRRTKAPDSDYHHVLAANTARMLAEEGVLVSIGAHGQREGLASHWEIWGFAQGGMSPVQALRAATVVPARALGYEADLGSLEPGKLADLVVIDADILADIYQSDRVTHVMLNGRLYDAATLNETVTGDRVTQPFYWQR